jgi:hypothetical protein
MNTKKQVDEKVDRSKLLKIYECSCGCFVFETELDENVDEVCLYEDDIDDLQIVEELYGDNKYLLVGSCTCSNCQDETEEYRSFLDMNKDERMWELLGLDNDLSDCY